MALSRRRFLATAVAGTTVGAAGCSVNFGMSGGLAALSTDDGSELWREDVGGVDASPVLVDDTVYVGSEGTMYALSARDGSERWATEFDVEGLTTVLRPTVLEDLVLVPVGETLAALARDDGSVEWRFAAGAATWAAPPVAGDTVVLGAGETDVYGVSLADGRELWGFSGVPLERGTPTVTDSATVLTSEAGVHALDLADGSERWTFETEKPAEETPAVGAGTVFVGTNARRLYALSMADGTERWRIDTSGGDLNVSAGQSPQARFAGGFVYVVDNTVLYAVEAESRDNWTYDVDGSFQSTVAGDAVYLGASLSSMGPEGQSRDYGQVYALDRRRGTERWATHVGGTGVETPPAVDDDAVYVGQLKGRVHALARDDGTKRWTHEVPTDVEDLRPLLTDDAVLVTTR